MSLFRSRWAKCPTCDGDKVLKDADGNPVKDEDDRTTPCPDCKGKGKIITPSMM